MPGSVLRRYQVLAWVVGTGLVILVCVGVPLQYAGHDDSVVKVVGPLHGFLYIVYLVVALEMAVRYRLSLLRTAVVGLAGTVPFMSFLVERYITRYLRGRQPVPLPLSARRVGRNRPDVTVDR